MLISIMQLSKTEINFFTDDPNTFVRNEAATAGKCTGPRHHVAEVLRCIIGYPNLTGEGNNSGGDAVASGQNTESQNE